MIRICLVQLFCLATACCAYSQENNSFAERQVYSTDAFSFEVPNPWFYAVPDAAKRKNVARCFLHSRLQVFAQGLFLVDKGQAAETLDTTIDGMTKVMKGANTAEQIERENVVLDGDKAVHLKSAVANYTVPCSVIVDDHNGKLYLIMMSIAKKNDLEKRDLMVKTLLRTWKWKDSKDGKSQNLENHEWAGEYYEVDGLGENISLILAPKSGYVFEWQGCMGLYDRIYGVIIRDSPFDGLEADGSWQTCGAI